MLSNLSARNAVEIEQIKMHDSINVIINNLTATLHVFESVYCGYANEALQLCVTYVSRLEQLVPYWYAYRQLKLKGSR